MSVARRQNDRESMLTALKGLAGKLRKRSLSKRDVAEHLSNEFSVSTIRYRFGSFGNALREAGLDVSDPLETLALNHQRQTLSDSDLMQALFEVEKEIGHEPTMSECDANCKYSNRPFKRFGGWALVLNSLRKWKEEKGILTETNVERAATANDHALPHIPQVPRPQINASRLTDRPTYGDPIDFRGLRHEPVNEQGVVFLFGMIAKEIGFLVEAVQTGFPDCEAKREISRGKWQRVRIEFEFESRNFRDHGHDANGCDVVICWRHNWPECPLEVVELQGIISKLPRL